MHVLRLVAAALLLASQVSPLGGGVGAAPLSGTTADPTAAARSEVAAAMAKDQIPGMAVAVIRDGKVIWSEAFGVASVELRAPATPETLFRLGSVSKLLTGTLAARLAQAGLIDLDRPIRSYLPEWSERHHPITLRQLLGHLGGIRHYNRADFDFAAPGGMIDVRNYPDRASILALFANDALLSEPGQKYVYSTYGFTLAGIVMEAATGRDFETLLREHVLEPGHVGNIVYDDRFRLIDNRSEAYDPASNYRGLVPPSAGPVVNAYPLNSAYKMPGGGFLADAASLARFGALHFEPGFLGAALYAQTFTSQRTAAGEETGVGLAWRVGVDSAKRRIYHHSGVQQGSRAHLQVYPDQRLSIAILSNLGNRPEDIAGLADRIGSLFLAGSVRR